MWVLVEPLSGSAMAEGEGSGSCGVAQALGLHGSCELFLLQRTVLQGGHQLFRLLGREREAELPIHSHFRMGLGQGSEVGLGQVMNEAGQNSEGGCDLGQGR